MQSLHEVDEEVTELVSLGQFENARRILRDPDCPVSANEKKRLRDYINQNEDAAEAAPA